jgi:hypothetical protein
MPPELAYQGYASYTPTPLELDEDRVNFTLGAWPADINLMNNYYVLRREDDFKIVYMDTESAERWVKAGRELRLHDSNENAQHAMAEWKASIPQPVPFFVRLQA